jgi:hypothetical protein
MYLIVDTATSTAAAVDPVAPDAIMKAAAQLGVTITTVLTSKKQRI